MVNDDVIRDESKSQWHHFMGYLFSETYKRVGMMSNTTPSDSAVLHSIERLDIGPIVQCVFESIGERSYERWGHAKNIGVV